jgi:Ca2+-binding RTX toxin-like protein
VLIGSAQNDTLDGHELADFMSGGAGDDTYVVDVSNEAIVETSGNGNDTVKSSVSFVLAAAQEIENLTLSGGGASNGTGNALANVITGNNAANILKGLGGQDTINGGGGIDTSDYSDKTQRVEIALNGGTSVDVIVAGVVEDSISGIENLIGGSDNDILFGDGLANSLSGGDGHDSFRGGAGSDTIDGGTQRDTADYSDKTQKVEVALNGATAVAVKVNGVVEDTISNIENIFGGSAGDSLIGDSLANTLVGGGGDDTFRGGGGADRIEGGDGAHDTADYSDKAQSVDVTLGDGLSGSTGSFVRVNGANEDFVARVENIIGGLAGDRLTGDSNANSFVGGGGNDTLSGAGGSDTLDGGVGIDTAQYSNEFGIEVALNGTAAVTVKVNGTAEDTIKGVENINSGKGNDRLIGDGNDNNFSTSAGDDFLRGGLGHDTLDGGTGSDTADYSDKTKKVQVILKGDAPATVEVNGAFEDSLRSIENVTGGSVGDKLVGDLNANSFRGLGGKDTINGGSGLDHADYSEKTKKVEVTLKGSTNTAVKVNGVNEDTLKNVESITGGKAGDKLTGDGRDNSFKGMAGKDTVDGGAGFDTADFSDKTKKVALTLNGATAVNVKVNGDNEDSIKSVENVVGGSAGDKLIGDSNANTFKGLGGVDTINGGAGVDTADLSDKAATVEVALNGSTAVGVKIGGVAEDSIKNVENLIGGRAGDRLTGDSKANVFKGLGGQDTIDGGAGADTADYSDKSGAIKVALNGAAQVTVTGDGDFIRNIEHVIGGSGNDEIVGDGLANRFEGGGGDDTFKGGSGKDTLIGGTGNDLLAGGDGADTFVFNTALSASTNVDRIGGVVHTSDVIQLDDAIFKKIGGTLDAGEFRAGAGIVAGGDANDRIIYDTTSGNLYFDIDGNKAGGKAAILFATITDLPVPLSAGDFVIV